MIPSMRSCLSAAGTSSRRVSAAACDGAPAAMRGRYMGVLGFVLALGLTIGPTCGVALHAARPALLWSACGALGVIAALFVWSSRKENGPTENSS